MTIKSPIKDDDRQRLLFIPFVGVGPRSFLDLFSMAHGTGDKIIRKNKETGETVPWDPKLAKLRLSTNTFSLNEIEKGIIERIKEIESPI